MWWDYSLQLLISGKCLYFCVGRIKPWFTLDFLEKWQCLLFDQWNSHRGIYWQLLLSAFNTAFDEVICKVRLNIIINFSLHEEQWEISCFVNTIATMQGTLVLWPNLSCIKLGGRKFEFCRRQIFFSDLFKHKVS